MFEPILVGLIATDLNWAGPGTDGWLVVLRLLSVVVFIAAAAVALWNAWAVLNSKRGKLAKLWSVVLAISCLVVLYVAIVFHLVGYSANY